MLSRFHQSAIHHTSDEVVRRRGRAAPEKRWLQQPGTHERPAPTDELQRSLSDLYAHQTRWLFASPRNRIELLERSVESVAKVAGSWVDVACEIKHIPAGSPRRAEEVLAGPVVALRYLRLLLRNEKARESGAFNSLPGRLTQTHDGRWQVPVLPVTRDLFDPVCFVNFRANVWLTPGLREAEANAALWPVENHLPATSLILGAGNVTGIVAADLLGKLFQDNQAALVKLHPLTAPLQPIFEAAFAPLVEAGVLRLIAGDAELGARAIEHNLVDNVHITGSVAAHDAILWGPSGADCERRRREALPVLEKPITSELGNVTPWIIVPGQYSNTQLQSQAEFVAASIVNNAGFNCVSTRVLVTCRTWPQREEFLSRLQSILSRHPRQVAYYPGAVERFERFTGYQLGGPAWITMSAGDELEEHAVKHASSLPRLPWTLFRDVDPHDAPLFCQEESFVPVCAEIPLDACDEFDFLGQATDFVNTELWGTLCATLTLPANFRQTLRGRTELHAALSRLRYGTVCLNQWSGLAFALLSLPWGGHPSGTLNDPQSGLGWVHNSFRLRCVEKTVLEGPLTVVPKPIWVPGYHHAEAIAWHLHNLYHQPSLRHVAELTYEAFAALFK